MALGSGRDGRSAMTMFPVASSTGFLMAYFVYITQAEFDAIVNSDMERF
jgi:hypothetical protein